MQDLPWRNIWFHQILLKFWTKICLWQFVLPIVIRVHNKDKSRVHCHCSCDFDLKQEAHLRLTADRSLVKWEKFVSCQVAANVTTQMPGSSLNFVCKQSRESVDLPPIRHPSLNLTTFVFRLCVVRLLLVDLHPFGCTDPLDWLSFHFSRRELLMFWQISLCGVSETSSSG